jgi:diguanylate cyclase (GGDEF)-like protein
MIKQSAAFDLAATELYSTLDPDAVVKIGLQAAAHLILPLEESVKEAFFFVVDGATASLLAHYNQEPEDELPETSFATSDIPLLERALSQGTACLFDIDTESMDRRGADVVTSLRITNGVAIGIRAEGINGVLAVTSHDRRPFSTAQGEQLTSFSTIVSLALSRAMQHAAEATTDALTGLANRREFNNRLATMPRDARYVLLSMDVDSLKRVNDKAGHAAGDELLRGVAQALRSSVRGSDIAARTGGDEFCAILHQPTAAQARAVADRVVAAVRMVSVGGMPGSVSVGFATVESGQNPVDRLASADAAMYRAKRAGGSRVSEADAAGARRVEPVSRRAVAS